jgi:hypothetical protein
MTMGDAIRQLDDLPYYWMVGKGRVREGEPLWAVQVFRQAISDDPSALYAVEGDSLDYCVTRVVAWHEGQKS